MRKVYLFLHVGIFLLLILGVIVGFFASHPQALEFLGKYFLKNTGLHYTKIEGSPLEGMTLHDVNYTDAIFIKTLHVEYNAAHLLLATPKIKKVKVIGMKLIVANLPSQTQQSGSFFGAFEISQLALENAKIIFAKETLSLDANATDVHYDKEIAIKKISLDMDSSYGKARLMGEVKANHFIAQGVLTPKPSIAAKYLGFLEGFPKSLSVSGDADLQNIRLHTTLERVSLVGDKNATVQNAAINFHYDVKKSLFDFGIAYVFSYDTFQANVVQRVLFETSGFYTSSLQAALTKQPIELPFKTLSANFSGDDTHIKAHLKGGSLELDVLGEDFKRFVLHAKSEALELSFLPVLPQALQKNTLRFQADATLDIAPFSLEGTLASQGEFCTLEGEFSLQEQSQIFKATLYPKETSELWEKYHLERLSPINLAYMRSEKGEFLTLDANILHLTLFKNAHTYEGWGNVGSAQFDTQVKLENQKSITLRAKIPSVRRLVEELSPETFHDTLYVDAQAEVNATLDLSKKPLLKSNIFVPWFKVKLDEKTMHEGENFSLKSSYSEKELSIHAYKVTVAKRDFYSKKPSKILFDTNATLHFKEFWIYDNVSARGFYSPTQGEGRLHLRSDSFHYESDEANVTLKGDISGEFHSNGAQNIEANVTLLDGVVHYEPTSDYTLSKDIIIIQEMRPPAKVKRSFKLHLNASKPIAYKTDTIDIHVMPDVTLLQELHSPLRVLGHATITDGKVTAGDRVFEFDKSEMYFNGESPINPTLNLNLYHETIDYVMIEIFITHTLASPVVIFSSNPSMSQNDILSYILFGEATSADFDSSTEGKSTLALSSLVLATGLKQILNDTSGIKIDTLNILTNEEGTLGYEIGTRFNKQIRVVYKNDTISSVILQYSLSKSIRIDVDVRETGQGVTILYVKDF